MKAWTAIKSAALAAGKFAASVSDDALAGVGILLVARGVYLIYQPAAYIVGGLSLVVVALLRAARAAQAEAPTNGQGA
jgi:hypothetical protein